MAKVTLSGVEAQTGSHIGAGQDSPRYYRALTAGSGVVQCA